jgi:D-beta-D-heptose 7-phosphate kinase/D-beta-D-heptose 1-phosphate adenosyltransferase
LILASGCFDGLHSGHVKYLQSAKRLAPRQHLKVAIAPDSYIRTKGREPYWPQSDRAHTVFALDCVDAVVLQEDDSVADIIQQEKPDIFVKGPDWQGKLPEDVLKACQDVGARIEYVHTRGRHTSEARG